jgi:hypothetical protein
VEAFISSPDNRNKKKVPDFGRFLPLFLTSKIPWEDAKHAGVYLMVISSNNQAVYVYQSYLLVTQCGF